MKVGAIVGIDECGYGGQATKRVIGFGQRGLVNRIDELPRQAL